MGALGLPETAKVRLFRRSQWGNAVVARHARVPCCPFRRCYGERFREHRSGEDLLGARSPFLPQFGRSSKSQALVDGQVLCGEG